MVSRAARPPDDPPDDEPWLESEPGVAPDAGVSGVGVTARTA
ncbi:MAG: hypothetical protein U1F43_01895 [Myxococcota bacterium]